MATAAIGTAQPAKLLNELVRGPDPAAPPGGEALVPAPEPSDPEPVGLTPVLGRLPVELEVAVPVRDFRVRNLLALEPGQVIETQWTHGEDLPLTSGEVQLAWTEFEVVETRLAVRVTRLA
jgi:flagellar motor switch/type III secretory pathway protein FliN